ncbi:nucleotide exchange factor GrpE [Rickettsiales bacterium]|nr:nucleotide exchange factor GrpE [Rickettsiales bacterium]
MSGKKFTDMFHKKDKDSESSEKVNINSAENEADVTNQNPESNSEIEKLQKDLQELKDMNNKLLSTIAHSQNESKMTQKSAEDKAKYAVSGFARDMINIFNTLNLAIVSVPVVDREGDEKLDNFAKGIEMTKQVLLDAFSRHGITSINPKNGDQFDNKLHEALSVIESDQNKDTIVSVAQIGFTFDDRLLSAAKVVVSKGN